MRESQQRPGQEESDGDRHQQNRRFVVAGGRDENALQRSGGSPLRGEKTLFDAGERLLLDHRHQLPDAPPPDDVPPPPEKLLELLPLDQDELDDEPLDRDELEPPLENELPPPQTI